MNFLKPEHCVLNRDRTPWNPNRKTSKAKGERQQYQCAKCLRWCYMADRCNLFEALPKRGSVSEEGRP